MYTYMQYAGCFISAAAFEYAYIRWARAAASNAPIPTIAWSVITAALGLFGVGGALTLPLGYLPYLGGICIGSAYAVYSVR